MKPALECVWVVMGQRAQKRQTLNLLLPRLKKRHNWQPFFLDFTFLTTFKGIGCYSFMFLLHNKYHSIWDDSNWQSGIVLNLLHFYSTLYFRNIYRTFRFELSLWWIECFSPVLRAQQVETLRQCQVRFGKWTQLRRLREIFLVARSARGQLI